MVFEYIYIHHLLQVTVPRGTNDMREKSQAQSHLHIKVLLIKTDSY